MTELQTFIDDLRAEGESLDAPGCGSARGEVGDNDACGRVDDRTSDRAPALDGQCSDPGDHRPGRVRGAVEGGVREPGRGLSTTVLPNRRPASRRSCSPIGERGRTALVEALTAAPAGTKFPWYGPPMGGVSMATARLMETWAHGQDVADALGVERAPTARIKNIAHLGVRTRNFAYSVNEKTPPADDFRVELTAPDGSLWTWGPEDAPQKVTGPALDFCLLVTTACQSRRSRSGRRGCRRGRVARVRAGPLPDPAVRDEPPSDPAVRDEHRRWANEFGTDR